MKIVKTTLYILIVFLNINLCQGAEVVMRLQNKSGLFLWLGAEKTTQCNSNTSIFSPQGIQLPIGDTREIKIPQTCPLKTIKVYTQDPILHPGVPVLISLYGQMAPQKSYYSFTIERTNKGIFVLKEAK